MDLFVTCDKQLSLKVQQTAYIKNTIKITQSLTVQYISRLFDLTLSQNDEILLLYYY